MDTSGKMIKSLKKGIHFQDNSFQDFRSLHSDYKKKIQDVSQSISDVFFWFQTSSYSSWEYIRYTLDKEVLFQ